MSDPLETRKIYLPIMLDVSNKNILLIGGGAACAEKLRSLGQLGKDITAISPEFCSDFNDKPWIKMIHRKYSPGDLKGFHIVYVGINDFDEEMLILNEAKEEGLLINFVDQVKFSDFISPSVLIKKFFSIFISTNGRGPGASKFIRREIEEKINLEELDNRAGEYIQNRKKKS